MTMPGKGAEFARPIDVTTIGMAESAYKITADASERAALAHRFDLLALERLQAEVRVKRLAGGLIQLSAVLSAEVVQGCVVTMEPVPSRIEEQFNLLYGAVTEEREVVLNGESEPVEPLAGGAIDLGEAVAQQLSLVLDPFPRAPAVLSQATVAPDEPGGHSPFAGLKDWWKTGKPDA
jgi:uncharacterized metal-binding protein YceD (DUF177 family)